MWPYLKKSKKKRDPWKPTGTSYQRGGAPPASFCPGRGHAAANTCPDTHANCERTLSAQKHTTETPVLSVHCSRVNHPSSGMTRSLKDWLMSPLTGPSKSQLPGHVKNVSVVKDKTPRVEGDYSILGRQATTCNGNSRLHCGPKHKPRLWSTLGRKLEKNKYSLKEILCVSVRWLRSDHGNAVT